MSEQPSLLELFEQSHADDAAIDPAIQIPKSKIQNGLNPFRKQEGPCTHHEHEREERLFWCHICGKIGCFEWLKEHKD